MEGEINFIRARKLDETKEYTWSKLTGILPSWLLSDLENEMNGWIILEVRKN